MSAYSVTEYKLFCDGRTPYGGEGRDHTCFKSFSQPENLDHNPRPAELRKLAARDGWEHVRSSLGRRFDRDFCPEHKPAAEAKR